MVYNKGDFNFITVTKNMNWFKHSWVDIEKDHIFQRRRKESKELFLVLLEIWSLMDVLQVLSYFILHLLRQLKWSHSLATQVKLVLEVCILFIDGSHQGSHVTEDKRSHDGTDEHNQRAINSLQLCSRSWLITNDQKNSIVEALEILLNRRILKEMRFLSIQIFRR